MKSFLNHRRWWEWAVMVLDLTALVMNACTGQITSTVIWFTVVVLFVIVLLLKDTIDDLVSDAGKDRS